MLLDIARHPCFNKTARHTVGRVHLPVAPDCNVQCNFCKRVYDCANESRPGVTSAVLTPPQARHYLEGVLENDRRIAVVGIAGPGDPFATAARTLETLQLVHDRWPDMLLCVASNGLNVAPHAARLASLGVSHATLTINAVDPAIGAAIYAWVRDGKRIYRGAPAAALLWDRQAEAIRLLKQQGVTVKINTIVMPGINDHHVAEIAQKVADLRADVINCVPLYPVAGTAMAHIEPPSTQAMTEIRAEAARHLAVMSHCTRCRADAVGLLGERVPPEFELRLLSSAALPVNPSEDRPYVAVATLEGTLVNQHLGEAERLAIFARGHHRAPTKGWSDGRGGFALVETRRAPPPGGGQQRWLELAQVLKDCRALLVAGAGESPRSVLTSSGIKVVMMEGLIEEGLEAIYRGAEIRAPLRRQHRCGSGCAGSGSGCM
jgi:nitrogen fixation protein NifB